MSGKGVGKGRAQARDRHSIPALGNVYYSKNRLWLECTGAPWSWGRGAEDTAGLQDLNSSGCVQMFKLAGEKKDPPGKKHSSLR